MSDVSERWLPVVGYEGFYEVSHLGRVRSLDRVVSESTGMRRRMRGRVLRPQPASQERRTVWLCAPGNKRRRFVYHLVLEAFVGPQPPNSVACHADGDPTNDRLTNVRWDTSAANQEDTVRHGRHRNATATTCPRGHALFPPNLQRSQMARRATRTCLSCHRASSNYRSALKRGIPADFQQMADDHYRRITASPS